MEKEAFQQYEELERGIEKIITAADIYAIHIMSKVREEEPPFDIINDIMSNNKLSGFSVIGNSYTKNELKLLEDKSYFREIGQQIIVATHTAFEAYLDLKFKEYYRYLLTNHNFYTNFIEKSLKKLNNRCLDDFKKNYNDLLEIHLPSFDIDVIYTTDGCSFMINNSWDAICLIDKTRNDIVHKGKSVNYKISTLMDSWYVFDFIRRWVLLFDANFDSFIYDKRKTELYKKYEKLKECALSNK
jgi:hypothetical protein